MKRRTASGPGPFEAGASEGSAASWPLGTKKYEHGVGPAHHSPKLSSERNLLGMWRWHSGTLCKRGQQRHDLAR